MTLLDNPTERLSVLEVTPGLQGTPTPPATPGEESAERRRPRGRRAAVAVTASAIPEYTDSKKWKKRRASRFVRKLQGCEIRAFIGTNGTGKSATAVMALLPVLRGIAWHCEEPSHLHNDPIYGEDGNAIACGPHAIHDGVRLVYSTVELTLPDGSPHPLYRRLNDWRQVIDAEHCDLLFDEVTGIANARDAMSLPRQVQVILDMLRKKDVTMSLTAPSFKRMDNTLRSLCKAIVICKGYVPERPKKDADTVAVSAWKRRRLFRCRVFDGEDFEDFTQQQARADKKKGDRLRPMFIGWWWGPKSEVFVSYSSKGAVARLGQANDSGACLDCGGTRVRPKCTCKH